MNVKNNARLNLHISIHVIISISVGNKWTEIICVAQASNWHLILQLHFILISACPSLVHEGTLLLPLETQLAVLETRLMGCICMSVSSHSWTIESWHFLDALWEKNHHCVMRKMTRSKCSYLFSLIMEACLRVLKRLHYNFICQYDRHSNYFYFFTKSYMEKLHYNCNQ